MSLYLISLFGLIRGNELHFVLRNIVNDVDRLS